MGGVNGLHDWKLTGARAIWTRRQFFRGHVILYSIRRRIAGWEESCPEQLQVSTHRPALPPAGLACAFSLSGAVADSGQTLSLMGGLLCCPSAVQIDHPSECHFAKCLFYLAPRAGFEPATNRLTAGCSTAELPGNSLLGAMKTRI